LFVVKCLGKEAWVVSAMAAVPTGIGDVTAAWLGEVLGTAVAAVRAERIAADTGFSSLLYRVHLTGDDVPASVIVKLPADSDARGAMEMMGGYLREVAFYREVAGRVPTGTPRVLAARTADDGSDFVLVLEDLLGWDNADHLAGLTLPQARTVIAELAGLHAWSMVPPNMALAQRFPSIDSPVMREILPAVFAHGWQIYRQRSAAHVAPSVVRHAKRFAHRAGTALTVLTEQDVLVHGDIRADNVFFSGERCKIVDYQMTARGVGAIDIAYLVSQGLPTALRAGRDEELVRGYLDELTSRGVRDYGFEAAWRHYRFAVAYMIVLPVVALVGWEGLPERSRRLCLTLTDRAAAAIDQIGATEVFDD
jgi:aminoglycoside phosphotransferase (APT) family kinase protein